MSQSIGSRRIARTWQAPERFPCLLLAVLIFIFLFGIFMGAQRVAFSLLMSKVIPINLGPVRTNASAARRLAWSRNYPRHEMAPFRSFVGPVGQPNSDCRPDGVRKRPGS